MQKCQDILINFKWYLANTSKQLAFLLSTRIASRMEIVVAWWLAGWLVGWFGCLVHFNAQTNMLAAFDLYAFKFRWWQFDWLLPRKLFPQHFYRLGISKFDKINWYQAFPSVLETEVSSISSTLKLFDWLFGITTSDTYTYISLIIDIISASQ